MPPSIINGGSSEKPLLKSLIAYGQVSGPSGGWLAVPEHQHSEGIHGSSKEREGRQRNVNLEGSDDDVQHMNMEPSEATFLSPCLFTVSGVRPAGHAALVCTPNQD